MPLKLNLAVALAWLLGITIILQGMPVFADPPAAEEVLGALGMDKGQIAELAQGQPITFTLAENRDDELAAGIALYLPTPVAKVAKYLRQKNPDLLDVGVTAHGLMSVNGGANSLAAFVLPKDEAQTLLNAEPGDEFNLSAAEIYSFKTIRKTPKRTPHKAIRDAVIQHYREILFQRFQAYRRRGTHAIAPYARDESPDSKPSLELRQAAKASVFLARYLPALYKAWLDYPKPLPKGANEDFLWVSKNVENRPAAILRHRVSINWNGGVLVLVREFYAPHSYNSSQWITGCLPFRNGTVVFQQVHSYTDQVAGAASDVKHIAGRELLKDKMLKSFDRLCNALSQCR